MEKFTADTTTADTTRTIVGYRKLLFIIKKDNYKYRERDFQIGWVNAMHVDMWLHTSKFPSTSKLLLVNTFPFPNIKDWKRKHVTISKNQTTS
jgi:hypothetical protein